MEIVESDPLGQRPITLPQLKDGVGSYIANQSVQNTLRRTGTEIVAVAGGVAFGKTEVVNLAVPDEHPRLIKIDTVTNRGRKESDPSTFVTADEGVTLQSLGKEIAQGDVINYEVIEQTGAVYATRPEAILGRIAVGPVATNCINQIINAFETGKQRFVYVLTDPDSWNEQIAQSLGDRHDAVQSRLPETIDSIEFALENMDLFTFIHNEHGKAGLQTAAERLRSIALRDGDHHSQPIITPAFVQETLESLLEHARKLAKSIH